MKKFSLPLLIVCLGISACQKSDPIAMSKDPIVSEKENNNDEEFDSIENSTKQPRPKVVHIPSKR